MSTILTRVRRSEPGRAGTPCTRFPRTRVAGTPVRISARRARVRARFPFLLAPVTVALTAVLTTLGGLSIATVVTACAFIAVVGGVVAHRAVGRLFSGSMLVLARPFAPGDRLRLYVPELGRIVEAELVRIGPITSALCTDTGLLVMPTGELLRPAPLSPL